MARPFRMPGIAPPVVAVALLAVAAAAIGRSVPDDLAAMRDRSLALVNEARSEAGLLPLAVDERLVAAAQRHAEDMLERDYYAHVTPDGRTVMDRLRSVGVSGDRFVAENIAQCLHCRVPADTETVEGLHAQWMDSPPHRENILAEGLSAYGFGLAESSDGTRYAVQDFAGPGVAGGGTAQTAARPLDPAGQTALAVSVINGWRRERGVGPVSADDRLTGAAGRIIPDDALSDVSLDALPGLGDVLPPEATWREYRLVVGSCGGCGTRPTDADVRFFLDRWRDDARYRGILSDPSLTAVGMAVEADGQGRKIAALVLAGG